MEWGRREALEAGKGSGETMDYTSLENHVSENVLTNQNRQTRSGHRRVTDDVHTDVHLWLIDAMKPSKLLMYPIIICTKIPYILYSYICLAFNVL